MQKSGTIIRYSFRDIVKILVESRRPGVREAEICWKYDIVPDMVRPWRKQYSDISSHLLMQMAGINPDKDPNREGGGNDRESDVADLHDGSRNYRELEVVHD